jgi:hypothetical protein
VGLWDFSAKWDKILRPASRQNVFHQLSSVRSGTLDVFASSTNHVLSRVAMPRSSAILAKSLPGIVAGLYEIAKPLICTSRTVGLFELFVQLAYLSGIGFPLSPFPCRARVIVRDGRGPTTAAKMAEPRSKTARARFYACTRRLSIGII